MFGNQILKLAHVLILMATYSEINGQGYYEGGLQHYYGKAPDVKPVRELTEDSPEIARFYRGESDTAQASLQYQPAQSPVQYSFQSPGYQQQQLQPLAYYQQQELLPQVLYQQQAQPQSFQPQAQQPGQLRSLQGFADPRFQQDYKNRMIYSAQLNPTQPPPPTPATPLQQEPSPFQFQPSQDQQQFSQLQQLGPQTQFAPSEQQLFTPTSQDFSQPQQFTAQPQGFAAPQKFAPQSQQFYPQSQQYSLQSEQFSPQPQPFAAQQEPTPNSKLGVSYSSAGLVSRTTFSGHGASYSF